MATNAGDLLSVDGEFFSHLTTSRTSTAAERPTAPGRSTLATPEHRSAIAASTMNGGPGISRLSALTGDHDWPSFTRLHIHSTGPGRLPPLGLDEQPAHSGDLPRSDRPHTISEPSRLPVADRFSFRCRRSLDSLTALPVPVCKLQIDRIPAFRLGPASLGDATARLGQPAGPPRAQQNHEKVAWTTAGDEWELRSIASDMEARITICANNRDCSC